MSRPRIDHDLALASFQPAVRAWFEASFPGGPTPPQAQGWPVIARGDSTLIFAPTGSGKTLAAFLVCLDRLMFASPAQPARRCRVVYVSPLKALAIDIERNLRVPLAGIAALAAQRSEAFYEPSIAVRTGDTPPRERARFRRSPGDLLITTPESLYLLLTSDAREALRSVDTVIIDEIHALVSTKRGAHLALSLERLERLAGRRLQRIGLSATQRPLDEVARFLGGAEPEQTPTTSTHTERIPQCGVGGDALHAVLDPDDSRVRHRPVSIIDAGFRRALELRVEVPVEDLARLDEACIPSTDAHPGSRKQPSIWSAIHPRLVELIRAHRSTLVFVNSRRLSERLAGAINELAGETLALAHHGSIAREQRAVIEDRLKAGTLPALVATSSLELGIDMGAIDLVVQIEAPISVASGLQRVGRAGHRMGDPSRGIIVPKYRGDLLACAAITRAMVEGDIEATHYLHNPLDVLAQQIVAMVATQPMTVEDVWALVRCAAPFTRLPRSAFESVLDLLAGLYASDDLAHLRPRLIRDRSSGMLTAREGAKRIAVLGGGTIPDRGLYGVYLAGADVGRARVGELDEEMVFESVVGETFLLGATSWRIEEITHDRVLVSPAPGEPGKMPFWKGDALGRPVELGRRIGRLAREMLEMSRGTALRRLERDHCLDERAARNLLQYLEDQRAATGAVPDDHTIVVERVRDELGDWRVCVLSPLGGRVLAPWAMALTAKLRDERGIDVETMWTNDGFVVRFPESDAPPDPAWLFPTAEEVDALVLRQLGGTALFAARFREIVGRALLIAKRRPGQRMPLWQLRKKSRDLLTASSALPSFPMLLETWRECLRDVFDLPALRALLASITRHEMQVVVADSRMPSPFASAILFGYVAQYLYDGDAPLAERRAQALMVDPERLRELIGDAELRELLDPDVISDVERELQCLDGNLRARSRDGVHDLLLRLGDLDRDGIRARCTSNAVSDEIEVLSTEQRAIAILVGDEERFVAVEHASRWRDALGARLPDTLAPALLDSVADPLGDLLLRHARTHGPFTARDVALRFGITDVNAEATLRRLTASTRLVEGAFRPGGGTREWCDPEVLRRIRQRSLAKLRRAIEPVEPATLARFATHWHGILRRGRGLDALLDVIERLQGAPLAASVLESDILAARLEGYATSDLDTLATAGEIRWVGLEPLGARDGRIALFLADALPRLHRPASLDHLTVLESRLVEVLAKGGASFFARVHEAVGGGFAREVQAALWALVWRGIVTNDSFHALRTFTRRVDRLAPRHAASTRGFRSRRAGLPAAEGRWSLVHEPGSTPSGVTTWAAATAQQLMHRHGLVSREVAASESIPGGFSALNTVLRRLEESGRIRRGWFVAGIAATQFTLPPVVDELRRLADAPDTPEIVTLAATDPANAWGAVLPWPEKADETMQRRPARTVGATVFLVNGSLAGWLERGARRLRTWLPDDDAERALHRRALAMALASLARRRMSTGLLLAKIDDSPAREHLLAIDLVDAGFVSGPQGFHLRALSEVPVP